MIPLTDRRGGIEWRGRQRDMQAAAISIDGSDLAAFKCWLTDARLGDAAPLTAFGDMPGRAGGIDQTLEGPGGAAVPSRRACEFDIATDCPASERAWVRFSLGRLLGRTVEVFYAPLGAALRGRLSAGAWDDAPIGSTCTLTLDAEPFALGERRVSSAAELAVGGSAWAEPTFELTVMTPTRNADLVVDGVRAMRVPSASGQFPAGTSIAVDSEIRSVRVNGSLACPTLDSDWPLLTPGAHAVACEGCEVKVAWRERYMF